MNRPEFPRVLLAERLTEAEAEDFQALLTEHKEAVPLHDIFIDEPSLGERTRLIRALAMQDPEGGPLQLQMLLKTPGRDQALSATFIRKAPASRTEAVILAVGKWFNDYFLKMKEYREAEEKKAQAAKDGQAGSSEETSGPAS